MASLILLLAINGAVFAITATNPAYALTGPLQDFMVFQPRVFWRDPLDPENIVALFASILVHANIVHLAGNAIGLLMITRAAEERVGTAPLLLAFVVCGLAGNLAYAIVQPTSIGTVGASGAIAGLMGIALVTNRARPVPVVVFPLTLNPLLIGPALVYFGLLDRIQLRHFFYWYMPVYAPVVLWLAIQVLGTRAMMDQPADNVNYLAHVGGFATGFLLAVVGLMMQNRRRRAPGGNQEPVETTMPRGYESPWTNAPPPRPTRRGSVPSAGGTTPEDDDRQPGMRFGRRTPR